MLSVARTRVLFLNFWAGLACGFGVAAGERGGSTEPVTSVEETPQIEVEREGGQIKISFSDVLQSASEITGPWSALTNATSPLLIDPVIAGRSFFRSFSTNVPSVFSSRTVVAWTLTGPLQTHFELAFAGVPDGIFPPRREKPYFEGTLKMGEFELPVSLRVRGNSSLQECPFPKLKVKVSREDRAGTPFHDAREIRVGSHCAEGGQGPVGRLRDERATYREALAYEVMELLGFTAPRVRRARIEYHDTSGQTEGEPGWELTRNAVVLDDIEVVGERLGGRALSDEELEVLADADFEEQLLTELQLFHALLGNWDYALSRTGQGLWNTDVIELADGAFLPVAGDFDLASWVTGEVRLNAPHDYRPDLPDLERQAHFETQRIWGIAGPDLFTASQERFLQHRTAVEEHVLSAVLDEPGRTNALQHLTAFYEALGEAAKPR
jgi:hypothetical protein